MNNAKEPVNSLGRRDHLVQFYSTPEALVEMAGHFIGEGLRKRETVVMIATQGHRAHFDAALEAGGPDLPVVRRDGRLIELDACETLARLMGGGQPIWDRFEAAIGAVLDRAGASGGMVRAYGEMVDVLWQAGNLSAALRLEGYWDRLLAKRRIPLFCAYRADILDADPAHLKRILSAHSHLVPAHADLEKAVNLALAETFGEERASALRPLMAAARTVGAKLPGAEAAVFWLKTNMPDRAEHVLERARVILANSVAA